MIEHQLSLRPIGETDYSVMREGRAIGRIRLSDERPGRETWKPSQGILSPIGMLTDPFGKTRSSHHLRGFAEIGDDHVVRAVHGENAEAGNRSAQAYRRGSQEGAPIWPPVGYVVVGSSHGPSAPLAQLSVGLIAAALRGGALTHH